MADSPDELAAAAARAFSKPFGALLRLDADGAAPLFVDGRGDATHVSAAAPEGAAPACVLKASRETFLRVLESERMLAGAYVSGRLVIAGDMSVMARIAIAP